MMWSEEVEAIQKTLDSIQEHIEESKVRPNDIIIFLDSQSAIQAVENRQDETTKGIENVIQTCDNIMTLYGVEISIQCIPGHSDIKLK